MPGPVTAVRLEQADSEWVEVLLRNRDAPDQMPQLGE
jgi:hypothetical protein